MRQPRLSGSRTRPDPLRTGDSYDARVAQTLAEMGIPASFGVDRHMPSYAEAKELVSVGMDIYGRDRQLTPHAAGRWTELRAAAHQAGIKLSLISAFRSLEYQRQIFERKIRAGESIERILKVNTPPGYSEHHTGRAVDLTTPGCPPLAEEFETFTAFDWLVRHARRFGFSLTYPRENRFGIAYEPGTGPSKNRPANYSMNPPAGGRNPRKPIDIGIRRILAFCRLPVSRATSTGRAGRFGTLAMVLSPLGRQSRA